VINFCDTVMKISYFKIPQRRRAEELYHRDSPFKGRSERPKTLYKRKAKHPNREDQQ
jgi:hypothetical protein